jgi:hypothetical protein
VSDDAVHQPTWPLLLKIEHMVKLQVLGNNSKTVNNIRRRTPSNSNSSHDSGELKKELEMLIVQEMLYLDIISSHCSQL